MRDSTVVSAGTDSGVDMRMAVQVVDLCTQPFSRNDILKLIGL